MNACKATNAPNPSALSVGEIYKLWSYRRFEIAGDQNSIREEIKSRLKSANACYYQVQNLLSSSLLSKNVNIQIYRTIILAVVLHGCETWSFTLREERRLRVFENRALRRIFGLEGRGNRGAEKTT